MNVRAPATALALALLVSACVPTRWEKPAEPSAMSMERSRAGNQPFYEEFGVRYTVMSTSVGYREQGIASWYGKKFHGRKTSNGERYDMYKLTAAHKSLPLPTLVRVTNLANGRSVDVRVNDRGPFVRGRIIDLSYAAALELDMIEAGTARVEVVALDINSGPREARTPAGARPSPAVASAVDPVAASRPALPSLYAQVGAFGDQGNARRLVDNLRSSGLENVRVSEDRAGAMPLYKVQVGPFTRIDQYDAMVARLNDLQITAARLVVDDTPPVATTQP